MIFDVEDIAEKKIETIEIRGTGKIARVAAKGLKLTAKKSQS